MMYIYLLEGRNHMFYTVVRKSKIKSEDLLVKLQNKEPECGYKNCILKHELTDEQHLCGCGEVVNTANKEDICDWCKKEYGCNSESEVKAKLSSNN